MVRQFALIDSSVVSDSASQLSEQLDSLIEKGELKTALLIIESNNELRNIPIVDRITIEISHCIILNKLGKFNKSLELVDDLLSEVTIKTSQEHFIDLLQLKSDR